MKTITLIKFHRSLTKRGEYRITLTALEDGVKKTVRANLTARDDEAKGMVGVPVDKVFAALQQLLNIGLPKQGDPV